MKPPPNMDLPYLAYGLFKPNELAFKHIEKFVDKTEKITIPGFLWVRDGLPMLDLHSSGFDAVVYLFSFSQVGSVEAYQRISEFVSVSNYEWQAVDLNKDGQTIPVNFLSGVLARPADGSRDYNRGQWRTRYDPLFNEGLTVVKGIVDKSARAQPFVGKPFNWERLFQLQMAYLLLWTIIERYCALAYGIGVKASERKDFISYSEHFHNALEKVVQRKHSVYDVTFGRRFFLNKYEYTNSIQYYYAVRSNLVHRGKASWEDGEIVRKALVELYDIFAILLQKTLLR